MRTNELQGRCLLARGMASQEEVSQAWAAVIQGSGAQDLCAVLVSWGRLQPAAAEAVRRTVASATSSGGWPTLVLTPPPPHHDRQADTRAGSGAGSAQSAPDSDATLNEGRGEFGRYELAGEISRGGMGVIYRAKHRRLGQVVALKVLLAKRASDEQLARFEREAKTLARLKHPNIVGVSDFGDEDGVPFFAMELVKGRDLKWHVDAHVKRYREPPEPAWTIQALKPIADALVACHQAGVIHRDLKPHNVLLERQTNRAVLVDFGLAHEEAVEATAAKLELKESGGVQDAGLTQEGALLGTPSYMAPEQVDAEDFGAVDDHTDVWGFGATLFYCLTGEAPYTGSSAINVYKKILTEDPRDAASLRRGLPAWLVTLCRRCLDRNPRGRPEMKEVHQIFEAHTRGPRQTLRAVVALCLVFAIGQVTWWLWPRPGLQHLEPIPEWTTKASVHVAGKTATSGSRVLLERQVGDDEWATIEDTVTVENAFSWLVPLDPGRNLFRVGVVGADVPPTLITTGRDGGDPRIRLSNHHGKVVAIPDPRGALVGRVEDESRCQVWANGEQVRVDDAGNFEVALRGERPTPVLLEAKDEVGRTTRVEVVPFRYAADLFDRERWQEADEERQGLAAEEVAAYLGDAYRLVGIEVYESGGQAHRIAAFEHVTTGIVLHLVPGGTYTMGMLEPLRANDVNYAAVNWEHDVLAERGHPPEVHRSAPERPVAPAQVPDTDLLFKEERPPQVVSLPPFLIGRTEVSVAEWERGPRLDLAAMQELPPNYPKVGVNWDQTRDWLKGAGDGLRLPSEAEWEYASRAGTKSLFFWGDDFDRTGEHSTYWLAAFLAGRSVGQPMAIDDLPRLPNAFGLVDTLGNVWEWCADAWEGNYKNGVRDYRPRGSDEAPVRVRRGGGFNYGGGLISRCSVRGQDKRDAIRWAIGFRVVRSLLH